jgi:hypothetical protein
MVAERQHIAELHAVVRIRLPLAILRVCLARLLLWLLGLISHKLNQRAKHANTLMPKSHAKAPSRAKHAERCFSRGGCGCCR